MRKALLITAGSISLTLGIIGIILPILPTTPFLLLSGACYTRSSERLYNWLINHKILGLYVKSYLEHRAITLKTKIVSITLMVSVMLTTMIFFTDKLIVRVILSVIAITVSIYIGRMKLLDNSHGFKEDQSDPN